MAFHFFFVSLRYEIVIPNRHETDNYLSVACRFDDGLRTGQGRKRNRRNGLLSDNRKKRKLF
jgi:hypothetical protein